MDLADLSVRTGFSEKEIEAIENGEQMIYQTDLMVLCAALNVSPKDIVGRSQSGPDDRAVGGWAEWLKHLDIAHAGTKRSMNRIPAACS